MIGCYIFILFGMALVSMCWALAQLKLSRFAEQLSRTIRDKVQMIQDSVDDSDQEDQPNTLLPIASKPCGANEVCREWRS
jgi:hypothetical protein